MALTKATYSMISGAPVNVLDFGAVGDGVTDDTAAVQAAITAGAGGAVYFPTNPGYLVNGSITLPVNTTLYSDSWRSTKIIQTGAFYAVSMGTGCEIRDIAFEIGASATGAIEIKNSGWAQVNNVSIDGLASPTCIGINLDETYRTRLSYVWVRNVRTGIKFVNNNTTFEFTKGNIGETSYRAIDGSNGSGKIIEAYIRTVYFEGCYGDNPIFFNGSGRVVMDSCGFELVAVNPSFAGSIADPKVILVDNPTKFYLCNSQFSGYRTDSQTYTGVLYFIYMGNDAPVCVVDNCEFTQNFAVGAYTYFLVRNTGLNTIVSLSNNNFGGGGFANALSAERSFIGGIDVTSGTRNLQASNNRIVGTGGFSYYNSKSPLLAITAPVTSSGTSSVIYTQTFPARSFSPTRSLKITAWGTRTGTAGTKQIILTLNAGGANAYIATASVTAADDWRSEIVIQWHTYSSAKINVVAYDDNATITDSGNFTRDTAANDLTINFTANCANAADSMTLDGLIIERG